MRGLAPPLPFLVALCVRETTDVQHIASPSGITSLELQYAQDTFSMLRDW